MTTTRARIRLAVLIALAYGAADFGVLLLIGHFSLPAEIVCAVIFSVVGGWLLGGFLARKVLWPS